MFLFLNVYLVCIKATNCGEIYKPIEEYNFYKEMENFQKYILSNFKQYEIEIKNNVVCLFENKDELKIDENEIEKTVAIFNINEKSENLKKNLRIFLQKYTDDLNKFKLSIEDIEMVFLEDYKNMCIYFIDLSFKTIDNGNKKKNDILQFIKDINFDEKLCSPIRLYNFERDVISKKCAVEAYWTINPIHELMPKKENENIGYNYIHILLNKLELYDVPLCFKFFINDLKYANMKIAFFYDKVAQRFGLFQTFYNNPEFYKTEEDDDYELMEVFSDIFIEENELFANSLNLKDYNNVRIFSQIFFQIQNVFLNFYKKQEELKNKINADFEMILKKYEQNETNDVFMIRKKYNEFHNCLSELFFDIFKLHRKYDYDLRQPLKNFINKIEDPKTNELLDSDMKTIINNKRNRIYNNNLKDHFSAFFIDIFINPDLEDYCKKFTRLVNEKHSNKEHPEIIKFLSKTTYKYNIERKKDIISQIETLFTDNQIKKECLITFEKLIDATNEVIDIRLEILVKRSYTNLSIFTPDLEKQMLKYIQAEKEFNVSMKKFIKNRIDAIDSPLSNEIEKKSPNLSNKNHERIQVNGNNDIYRVIIFTLIIISVAVLMVFIVFKFK